MEGAYHLVGKGAPDILAGTWGLPTICLDTEIWPPFTLEDGGRLLSEGLVGEVGRLVSMISCDGFKTFHREQALGGGDWLMEVRRGWDLLRKSVRASEKSWRKISVVAVST
jgi:hypothetical protein